MRGGFTAYQPYLLNQPVMFSGQPAVQPTHTQLAAIAQQGPQQACQHKGQIMAFAPVVAGVR